MEENIVEQILLAHITEENARFVFPTQIALDRWTDRIISMKKSPVHALAMERFLAWDDFKGTSIRGQKQPLRAIPAIMRKVFANQLIEQNAEKPFLQNLIVPKYAKTAANFSDWISSILPSLALWKRLFDSAQNAPDAEDADFLAIYNLYTDILARNGLFDPAWETPPFVADGNHYFVFFPEILSDYAEYQAILESSPDQITVIHVPDLPPQHTAGTVNVFSNSRAEIKNLALLVRRLHEQKNIPWQEIAVSVPEIESYGPYIEREFDIFQIPYVQRNAKELGATAAGAVFRQILDCVNSDFSYASLRTLLLNSSLPWKDSQVIEQLLEFGYNNNCICSFTYNKKSVDVWEESFLQVPNEERAFLFYKQLKSALTELASAADFEKLRIKYFAFREIFFDMTQCPPESDRIISRCITELAALIDLQKEFPECKSVPAFKFFVNHLDGQKYLAQTDRSGVFILPYKTASTAPFACHILVNAGQASLSAVFKRLPFLNETKHATLFKGADDPNVTELFLRLYQQNSRQSPAYFSCATKTFTGYAQASSYLEEITPAEADPQEQDVSENFYQKEKAFLLTENPADFPPCITQTQKNGFLFWQKSQPSSATDEHGSIQLEQSLIQQKQLTEGKIRISATTLKNFFKCNLLYRIQTVCGVHDLSSEPELMDHTALGLLYHSFYEIYCKTLKSQNKIIHTTQTGLTEEYQQILAQSFEQALQKEDHSYLEKELLQTTKTAVLQTLQNSVEEFSKIFEGCTVLESEASYSYVPNVDAGEVPHFFTGRIDCLLLDPSESECILVDFKGFDSAIPKNLYAQEAESPAANNATADSATSALAKQNAALPEQSTSLQAALLQSQTLPDFQMPMYIHLLEHQEKPQPVENCCFFNVTKGTVSYVYGKTLFNRIKALTPRSRMQEVTKEDFAPTQKLFLECAEHFANAISTDTFTPQNVTACYLCEYKALCRTVFNVGKKD